MVRDNHSHTTNEPITTSLHCLIHHLSERFNKKCKNLTSNKQFPFESLANALVRDATARYHRWRLGIKMTRHDKMPRTEVRVFVCVCASTNVSGIYITTFCGKVECYDVAPDTFPQEVCDTNSDYSCCLSCNTG